MFPTINEIKTISKSKEFITANVNDKKHILNNFFFKINNKYFYLKGSAKEFFLLIGLDGNFISDSMYKINEIHSDNLDFAINDIIVSIGDLPLYSFFFVPEYGDKFKVVLFRNGEKIEKAIYLRKTADTKCSFYIKEKGKNIYIKINNFNDTSMSNIITKYNNGEHITFDLRSCMGGSLKIVTCFLENIVSNGKYLFTMENDNVKMNIFSKSNLLQNRNIKITILFNETTASSAELFIVVLNEYYKIKFKGLNSYGKATVISKIKLNDFVVVYPKYLLNINGDTFEKCDIKNILVR